jgi:putative transposase
MPILERPMVDIREEMSLLALDGRLSVTEVALQYGVTRPTVRLWRDRYREHGRAGLVDRSHAPHRCPHQINEEIEQLIVAERKRFGWGSKKILRRLADAYPDLELPGRSAIDAVLGRNGLVAVRARRRASTASPFQNRYTASEPAELMTIDHKGQFRLKNRQYCFPLTMVDNVSRYVLACEALGSTRLSEAWPVITRVFNEHGLPRALQSDNGPPFGSPNGRLSTMSVRLMVLGVLPVFGRPAHPQDNGRHERMHRDLKRETTRPPASTRAGQQKQFDEFVNRYNRERPHEALSMRRPTDVFIRSPRPYPRRHRGPEYESHFEVRKVTSSGQIKFAGKPLFIAHALDGQSVGLEPIDDQLYAVHFYTFRIGTLDTARNTFT